MLVPRVHCLLAAAVKEERDMPCIIVMQWTRTPLVTDRQQQQTAHVDSMIDINGSTGSGQTHSAVSAQPGACMEAAAVDMMAGSCQSVGLD
jgi:hypothetical protein